MTGNRAVRPGGRDALILFSTRIIRLFCYGFLSVVLALYLAQVGLDEKQIGLLFTLTLAGDAGITLWLTTSADRLGRKRTLILGALLMLGAGLAFLLTRNFLLLAAAAIIGVISPSGNEIGPFLSVEQAALTQLLPDRQRTHAFAWYSLAGSLATASGALAGGWLAQFLIAGGTPAVDAYHSILWGYALGGVILGILFLALSPAVEATRHSEAASIRRVLGLSHSRSVVFRLSALFAMDAFAGGLIVQAMIAYWFHVRFGVDPGIIGSIFFGANILAGLSALLAVRLAARFGLINTMVFTHIPSNLLLILVPLMPSLPWAVTVLLLRFSISQMDVPTRQSYTMGVVAPDERSAASGVTTIARSVGAAISPTLTGIFLATPALINVPFFAAGTIKILYDVLLYRSFVRHRPPEEQR
ncbi:MAG: MFS transporter [Bacteroidota bacterium]